MESLLRSLLRLFKAKAPGLELLDLHEDLLREILLRIGFPADLIRASAACVAFRRLVTEASFSRRYRSIHPPLLLGFLSVGTSYFQPAEAPHPNATAARVLDLAAIFSLKDRLPRRHKLCHWETCDLRDGRILLKSIVGFGKYAFFGNLAVCDPLSLRYLMLPLIPDNLLASFQLQRYDLPFFEAFLVPSTEEDDETSFKVIGLTMTNCKLVVFVFSSGSGCWSLGTSANWEDLNLPPDRFRLERAHCVYGCFFWKVQYKGKLLKLDMGIMELSTHDLPPGHDRRFIAIADAGEGELALFSHRSYKDKSVDYYTTIVQNKNERDDKWQMISTIPLPANHENCICGAADRYVFIVSFPRGPVRAVCFSLEVKSLKIGSVRCFAKTGTCNRISGTRHPCHGK